MTRKEAKILMPVIQAFADGKDVETKTGSGWISIENMSFAGNPDSYRIKPEPKYRPFKDAEECWQEMLKHQPFGWVKFQGDWFLVVHIDDKSIGYGSACGVIMHSKFDDILKSFTFANGTPFGILEEE